MTPAERQKRYRDRQRGGPARVLQPHGTRAAIRRHERNHEQVCDECRTYRNELARWYYANRRGRA